MNEKPKSVLRVSEREKKILQMMKEIDFHSSAKWNIDSIYNKKDCSFDTIVFNNMIGFQGWELLRCLRQSNDYKMHKYFKLSLVESEFDDAYYILSQFSIYSDEVIMISSYPKNNLKDKEYEIYAKFKDEEYKYKELTAAFTLDLEQCKKDFLKFVEFKYKDKLKEYEKTEKKYIKKYGYVSFNISEENKQTFIEMLNYYIAYHNSEVAVDKIIIDENKNISIEEQLENSEFLSILDLDIMEYRTNILVCEYLLDKLSSVNCELKLNVQYALYNYIMQLIVDLENTYGHMYLEYKEHIKVINEFIEGNKLHGIEVILVIDEDEFVKRQKVISEIYEENKKIKTSLCNEKEYSEYYFYLLNTDLYMDDTTIEVKKLIGMD